MSGNGWALASAGALMFVATAVALSVLVLTAKRVKVSWQEGPPSPRARWFLRTFCTPLFWQSLLQRTMRRSLERNPISWLHQYSWSSRLTKWGWCLAVLSVETVLAIFYDPWRILTWQYWMAGSVFLGMSLSSVSSFRQERQSGALELLLVTPISEKEVILGRLWGIWNQFAPALAIILVVSFPGWVLIDMGYRWRAPGHTHEDIAFLLMLFSRYLAVPIVGLYFSMFGWHFLTACLVTFGLAVCAPSLIVTALRIAYDVDLGGLLSNLLQLLLEGGMACTSLILLRRNLVGRRFSFVHA